MLSATRARLWSPASNALRGRSPFRSAACSRWVVSRSSTAASPRARSRSRTVDSRSPAALEVAGSERSPNLGPRVLPSPGAAAGAGGPASSGRGERCWSALCVTVPPSRASRPTTICISVLLVGVVVTVAAMATLLPAAGYEARDQRADDECAAQPHVKSVSAHRCVLSIEWRYGPRVWPERAGASRGAPHISCAELRE